MPSNNSTGLVHYLAGKHPGKIGWMFSPFPNCFKEPRHWLPYVLDNGKFAIWSRGGQWEESAFIALLDRCKLAKHKPQWVVVPDEVGNRDETLRLWSKWELRLRGYGWPLAFAAQDGMTPGDVPDSVEIVFMGGTTRWKWRNVQVFRDAFPRVHVGRVNSVAKLEYCESIGVESCDGTGFFRGGPDGKQAHDLLHFIAGRRTNQLELEIL